MKLEDLAPIMVPPWCLQKRSGLSSQLTRTKVSTRVSDRKYLTLNIPASSRTLVSRPLDRSAAGTHVNRAQKILATVVVTYSQTRSFMSVPFAELCRSGPPLVCGLWPMWPASSVVNTYCKPAVHLLHRCATSPALVSTPPARGLHACLPCII